MEFLSLLVKFPFVQVEFQLSINLRPCLFSNTIFSGGIVLFDMWNRNDSRPKTSLKHLLVIYLTISFQLSHKFSKLNVPPWFFSSIKTNLWILASQPFGPHQVAQHQMPKIRSPAWLRGNGSLEPGGPSRNQWGSCFNRAKAVGFFLCVEKHGFYMGVLCGVHMVLCSFFYGVNMVLIGFYLFFMWFLELYLWEHVWKCSAMSNDCFRLTQPPLSPTRTMPP